MDTGIIRTVHFFPIFGGLVDLNIDGKSYDLYWSIDEKMFCV